MTTRPTLARDDASAAVTEFVRGLQEAIEAADADRFNEAFAADVLWGSPFGLVVESYDKIHAIHERMFAAGAARPTAERGGSRYEIEHARLVAAGVALAYVRRYSLTDEAKRTGPQPGNADTFDELALFVLVRRDDAWWLAAGLHTPDRRKEVYG